MQSQKLCDILRQRKVKKKIKKPQFVNEDEAEVKGFRILRVFG